VHEGAAARQPASGYTQGWVSLPINPPTLILSGGRSDRLFVIPRRTTQGCGDSRIRPVLLRGCLRTILSPPKHYLTVLLVPPFLELINVYLSSYLNYPDNPLRYHFVSTPSLLSIWVRSPPVFYPLRFRPVYCAVSYASNTSAPISWSLSPHPPAPIRLHRTAWDVHGGVHGVVWVTSLSNVIWANTFSRLVSSCLTPPTSFIAGCSSSKPVATEPVAPPASPPTVATPTTEPTPT
jgi:hypothetical protein